MGAWPARTRRNPSRRCGSRPRQCTMAAPFFLPTSGTSPPFSERNPPGLGVALLRRHLAALLSLSFSEPAIPSANILEPTSLLLSRIAHLGLLSRRRLLSSQPRSLKHLQSVRVVPGGGSVGSAFLPLCPISLPLSPRRREPGLSSVGPGRRYGLELLPRMRSTIPFPPGPGSPLGRPLPPLLCLPYGPPHWLPACRAGEAAVLTPGGFPPFLPPSSFSLLSSSSFGSSMLLLVSLEAGRCALRGILSPSFSSTSSFLGPLCCCSPAWCWLMRAPG
jgi:hypothetical protein